MNRAILITLIVGLVIAVGYLVATRPATAPTDVSSPSSDEQAAQSDMTETDTNPTTARGTFAEALAQGGSGQCTFSNTNDGVSSEGEFWFADGSIRVEAITRVDGEVYTSNMINDTERVYIWGGTAGGMQAIVMDASQEGAEYEAYADTSTDAQVDMQQEVSYTCDSWTPNQVQFTPPADIEFVDMNAVMGGYFEGELRGAPEGMDF